MKRASADVGLMFTALNLRRIINLLDKNGLKKFLQELCCLFFIKCLFTKAKQAFLRASCFFAIRTKSVFNWSLKGF